MSRFLRFMRFCSDYELQRINTRMLRLLDSYASGEIGVEEYLRRRKSMNAEKKAAMDDVATYDALLDGQEINQEASA